ncbi:hypothetical protein Salat_1416000 [Sesamum alatum]|uniref:GRF-type domain-containing protein n=1 Tax=Sesamum alatum TaxID=300844 RepID=A0AAE1YA62_9LAMI|nr:hypothetical protein Salat_1416000 [Sesamum alatum]
MNKTKHHFLLYNYCTSKLFKLGKFHPLQTTSDIVEDLGASAFPSPGRPAEQHNNSPQFSVESTSGLIVHTENHLLLCECGTPAVMRTSWTPTNPGRRFRGCPGKSGHYCSTFEWVDEPGCEQCMTVIPGLLRRLSRSTTDAKAFEERIWYLEGRIRTMRTKMYIIVIGAALVIS